MPLTEFTLAALYALNASESHERSIKLILQQPAPLHILVIDVNSSDDTGHLADQLSQQDNRVQVFYRSWKLGLGAAYKLACERVVHSRYAGCLR
jgi:dolichol-phosphate mannosyltransferase